MRHHSVRQIIKIGTCLALFCGAFALSGCQSQKEPSPIEAGQEDYSNHPWNRPEKWEGNRYSTFPQTQ